MNVDIWQIYKKAQEWGEHFCKSGFYYSDIKIDSCSNYINEKLLEQDLKRLRAFRGESSISTFTYIVAKRLFLDFKKQLYSKINFSSYDDSNLKVVDSLQDAKLEFENLLKFLDKEQRLILLYKRDGLTSKEIAKLLDKKPKEIDNIFAKIKNILKSLEK